MPAKKPNIFSSRPFYNQYTYQTDLHQFLANKLVWLLFLNMVMFILFAVCMGIGYQPDYLNRSVLPLQIGLQGHTNFLPQPLPQNIRTFRAVGIFFGAWYVMLSAWLIKLGINMVQKQQFKFGYLYCFSFIFGLNTGLWIYELIHLNWTSFWLYVKSWFANDRTYNEFSFKRSIGYWLAVVSLIITSPIIWFSLFRSQDLNQIKTQVGYNTNLWFDSLQYFTIETNLLCYLVLVIYVFNPQWKIFKYNDVLIALGAYIIVVSLTFNFGILPFNFEKSYKPYPYKIARTVFEHIINPIMYVLTFVFIFKTQGRFYNDYLTTLKYSLIVPAIYGVYVLITPLMCGTSVYSSMTNTNPDLVIGHAGHGGSYWMFLIYPAFVLIFTAIITLLWWTNRHFWVKQTRVILYNSVS